MPRTEADLVASEINRCADDFIYFCKTYCKVEDKDSHQAIPFELYPAQERVARRLLAGEWLIILKARRLGLTWLLCAYAAHLLTFKKNRTIAAVSQDGTYAEDVLKRVKFINDNLPGEMWHTRGRNNTRELEFPSSGGRMVSVAPTSKAIHSLALDLVIFDEASRIDRLTELRRGAEPALNTSSTGQAVMISTSDGPRGEFFKLWQDAASPKSATKYKPVFLDWRERPGCDQKWYDAEAAAHLADPLYMKQQYPSSPEEAFESAEGRVYPLFVRDDRFIRSIELHEDWKRYRAIDWGGTDPFVCLWGAVVPGDGPGLTVDPACVNTINELLGYSYDDGKPQEHENHACDALRYLVITPGNNGITGHLHIYREIYEPNSAARGFGPDDMARRIVNLTGKERIELTVADRARADSIQMYENMGIKPIEGQPKLGGDREGEIEQGIRKVNALVVGWAKQKKVAIPGMASVSLPKKFNPGLRTKVVQARKPLWG